MDGIERSLEKEVGKKKLRRVEMSRGNVETGVQKRKWKMGLRKFTFGNEKKSNFGVMELVAGKDEDGNEISISSNRVDIRKPPETSIVVLEILKVQTRTLK